MIKKILFSTALFASMYASSFAGGATSKTFYTGANLGFNSSKSTTSNVETKISSYNFSPEFGVNLSNNWGFGIAPNIGNTKNTGSTLENNTNTSGATIYARRFFPVSNGFKLFAGLGYNMGSSNGKNTLIISGTTVSETKVTSSGAFLQGGLAYSVSPRFTLVGVWAPGLGFKSSKTTNTVSGIATDTKDSEFGFNVQTLGINPFNVGFYYSLNK